jgi:hypothetical protein
MRLLNIPEMTTRANILVLSLIMFLFPIYSWAGYQIVDREGKVLNKDSEDPFEISSTDKKVVFNGRGGVKVFEVEWDAASKKLIVKGEHVYLQIYNNGKIERLTTVQQGEQSQIPIAVQPVIPIMPRQKNPPQSAPQTQPTAPAK